MDKKNMVYIINEEETALKAILATRDGVDENMDWVKLAIRDFEKEGEKPHRIWVGETAYKTLGEPSEISGIPVSIRK